MYKLWKILSIVILLINFSNYSFAQSKEKVKLRLENKHQNFDASQIKEYTNKLFISEGHFECKKDFNPTIRYESTSDGIYQSFVYIAENGKVLFNSSPVKITNKKNDSISDFNAMIYKKKNKYIIDRVSCSYPILGIDMGCGISRSEAKFNNEKIVIKQKTDSEHCDVYKLYEGSNE